MENIQVGTFGWQHEKWNGSFYPEDMPEDWQLDFYANTYRVVLVPEKQWCSWSSDEIAETVEAVEGEFSFFFELVSIEDETTVQALEVIAKEFGELAAGIVVFGDDVENVSNTIANLPVTMVSSSAVLETDLNWQWQTDNWMCSGNPCGVLKTLISDAKQQTALLKSFMQSLPDDYEGAALIVYEDVDMQQLNNLKVIGELLGY